MLILLIVWMIDTRSLDMHLLAGGPISSESRSQATVALSTMKAEYMAAATATQEASR